MFLFVAAGSVGARAVVGAVVLSVLKIFAVSSGSWVSKMTRARALMTVPFGSLALARTVYVTRGRWWRRSR